MQIKTFPFFYHPGTVVIVDDQMSLLESMLTSIQGVADCRGFTNPKAALEFLNQQALVHPLFKKQSEPLEEFLTAPSVLNHFLSTPERFRYITTVIVDYTMPTMNGLEFCAQITCPYIRKIMLTGDASLDIAIQAFNDGLIHKFFKKHTPQVFDKLNLAVQEARLEHFSDRSAILIAHRDCQKNLPTWMHEAAEEVINLILNQEVVEFYVLNEKGDLLLLKANGEKQLLMIRDEKGMREQSLEADMSYKMEPDPEDLALLNAIKNHEKVMEPIAGDQTHDSLHEQENLFHPAKVLEIKGQKFYYAFAPGKSSNLQHYLGIPLDVFPLLKL